MGEKEALKKVKEAEDAERKLIDTSIQDIEQSINAESEFEKDLKDFEGELSKIERLQAESTSRNLFGGLTTKQIQMSDAEKKRIEKEVSGNDQEKADYVLEKNRLDELKKDLSELEDYLSKEVGVSEPPKEVKKSAPASKTLKTPSMPAPKKPKSGFNAPKAPSMPAPRKPK